MGTLGRTFYIPRKDGVLMASVQYVNLDNHPILTMEENLSTSDTVYRNY